MSPEKEAEKKFSNGFRIRRRRERTEANRILKQKPITVFERQRRMNLPAWNATKGLLNLATYNNTDLRELYEDPQGLPLARRWHDALYKDKSTGSGEDTIEEVKFLKSFVGDKNNPPENDPQLMIRFSPLLLIVNRAFGLSAKLPTK